MQYQNPSMNLACAELTAKFAEFYEREGRKEEAVKMKEVSKKHMDNFRNEKHKCKLCGLVYEQDEKR